MVDVVSPTVRSRMMSGIRGTNTRPEIIIRKGLHHHGFRFRKNYRKLPGKPDIVLPKYRAVIFVHGCFWHRHHCHLFKWPATRPEFWRAKINGNRKTDAKNLAELESAGWRVLTIWECSTKGKTRLTEDAVIRAAISWVVSGEERKEIEGHSKNRL